LTVADFRFVIATSEERLTFETLFSDIPDKEEIAS